MTGRVRITRTERDRLENERLTEALREANPTGHQRLDWAGPGCFALYSEVHRERIRAHLKHGAAGNSREDQPWDEHEWLAILTEELGEVAHELTYDQSGNPRDLRKELVQVAAMACAWIAAIDEFTA